MAPKHGWDRLINLSGDALQDYRAIQPYLEQVIRSGKSGVIRPTPKGRFVVEFTATVKGEQVVVKGVLENNVFKISDAWVQTRGQTP